MINKIKHWIACFFCSILLAWLITFYFLDSIVPWVWDDQVRSYVNPPGTYVWKSEGWGATTVGHHGVIGKYRLDVKQLVFWGDSFVEALHVDDRDKMFSQFNLQWSKLDQPSLNSISVGRSGKAVADYYFNIPEYERLYPNVAVHVIVIGNFNDLLPNQDSGHDCQFVSDPTMRFVPVEPPKQKVSKLTTRIKLLLNRLNLQVAWVLYRDLFIDYKSHSAVLKNLRFNLGPVEKEIESDASESKLGKNNYKEIARFHAAHFNKVTDKPVIFVYCPTVPVINDGDIQFVENRFRFVKEMALDFEDNGIGFVDLSLPFIQHFHKTKRLPRGFTNTIPGKGHLNKDGHYLVAKALVEYMLNNYESYF